MDGPDDEAAKNADGRLEPGHSAPSGPLVLALTLVIGLIAFVAFAIMAWFLPE